MRSCRLGRGALSVLAVGLSAALISQPVHADSASTLSASPYPPPSASYPAGTDPWLHPPQAGDSPAPPLPSYPPVPAPYPAYPYFVPHPMAEGSPAAANLFALGGVFVEIKTSSRLVRIERVIAPGTNYTVCVSPCRQVLPRNSVYVITGDGVRTTSQFVLPDDRDRVVLNVDPGSTGQAVGGGVLMGVGGITAYLGLIAAAASGLQFDSGTGSPGSTSNNTHNLKTTGEVMIVGGLIAGVAGLYLLFDSKTKVTSSTGTQFSEGPNHKHGRFAFTTRGVEF